MRNSVSKAIKNRVYGNFSPRGRDLRIRTHENWVWAVYNDKGKKIRVDRILKLDDKESNGDAAARLPELDSIIIAWNPVEIRDMGPRRIYQLAKKYYKQKKFEEMEKLFQ